MRVMICVNDYGRGYAHFEYKLIRFPCHCVHRLMLRIRKLFLLLQKSGSDSPSAPVQLLTARNIQRPQLSFRDKIDNSNNPFMPIIAFKPHALKPLQGQNYRTRFEWAVYIKVETPPLWGGDVVQLVESWTDTLLMQVQFPGAARDFSPRVSFQCRLSYGICTSPHAFACSNMCTF